MKHSKIFLTVITVAVFATVVNAQEFMNRYPNGNDVREVVFQGDYAWSATYGSLVRWDKRDGSYIQFTKDDGLASNNVEDVLIAEDGKLWIITTGGVNIYDGQNFETLTPDNSGLTSKFVFCVTQTDDGAFWFGTMDGISKFDGDSWTSFLIEDIVTDQSDNGYVSDIVIDKSGVIWALVWKFDYVTASNNRRYLSSFDGTTWTTHNGADGTLNAVNVIAIAVDNKNLLWAATSGNDVNGPLYTFDGTDWTDTGFNAVRDIDVDENGTVYFARGDTHKIYPAKDDKYITTFDGSSFVDLPIADLVEYPVLSFSKVFIDEPGKFWFQVNLGNAAYILYSYDGVNAHQHSTVGPLSFVVNEMIVDSSNTKWLATTYGISRYDGKEWENIVFESQNGEETLSLSNEIRDIAADKEGNLWLATFYGVKKYNETNETLYDNNTDGIEMMDYGIKLIAVGDNNVKWFVGSQMLYSYDNKTWTSYSLGDYKNANFNSMEVDKNNVIWLGIGTESIGNVKQGVVSFDGENWTAYNIDNSPLKGEYAVIAVAEDNTKWIGTSEGYYSFDGTTWTSYEDVKNASYPGLQSWDIYIDNDGMVWFMIQGHFHSFDGSVWDDHGKEDYGTVFSFVIDNDDVVWIVSQTSTGYVGSFNKAAIMTGVAENEKTPDVLTIMGNYPNPFNPSTTIEFMIPEYGTANLVIYNITGQKVRDLVSGQLAPGTHHVVWNGRDNYGSSVSSGVYICRLKSGEQVMMKQMMLLK